MWSVFGAIALLSAFESVFAQNGNETSQNQTNNDRSGSGASFSRNLNASFPVSDADLAPKSSDFLTEKLNISEPSRPVIEKRENIVEFNTSNETNVNEHGDAKNLANFRPSPQLETLYEHNKFPVKPAFPEAKTIPGYDAVNSEDRNSFGIGEVLPVENEKSRNTNGFEPGISAFGNTHYPNYGRPTWATKNENNGDTPWISRVRFPTGAVTSENSQYPFVTNPVNQKPNCLEGIHENQQTLPQNVGNAPQGIRKKNEYLPPSRESVASHEKGGYLPPIQSFTSSGRSHGESKHDGFASSFSSSGPSESFNFNKLIEIPRKYFSGEKNSHATSHNTYEPYYNLMEKPAYETHQKTYGGGYGMSNPWKKILKLFATFIPIGLLISALTPTVITVTNVNDTDIPATRYRSADDDPKKQLQNHILSSLDYFNKLNENGCEYRVFCELLVSASHMTDSERHVDNLLDNFAKQAIDYKSRAEDLKRVFEAVRNQDCNPIACDFIKNPT